MPQTVTRYPHGLFSWTDLSTSDQAAAKTFYGELMGWDSNDQPVGDGVFYTMFELDGHSVAGGSGMQPDQLAQGIPPHWLSYITVDDVDAVAARVADLGGTLLAPPFDVMEAGRMAVLADPTGATVALWQPRGHIGSAFVNVPGALCWNELATRDPHAAGAFFSELLGWSIDPSPEMPGYWVIRNGDRMNGGIIQMTDEWEGIPPHWMVYFAVEDCDAAAAKATALGGVVHVAPQDIPGTGRFAVLSDPQGATFTVMMLETADPPPSA